MRITARAAVWWPKTRIIPARLERAFTLAKTSEISAEFQKITLRRWVFRFGFSGVFRGSCLATFNEKPECEKDSGFFYASVNGTIMDIQDELSSTLAFCTKWLHTELMCPGCIALWCSGLCSRLFIRGSWIPIPLGTYARRQGILSTIVSLNPRPGCIALWCSGLCSRLFIRGSWIPIPLGTYTTAKKETP